MCQKEQGQSVLKPTSHKHNCVGPAGARPKNGDKRLPKVVMYGELRSGKRKQGGLKLRYKDVISRHLKEDLTRLV